MSGAIAPVSSFSGVKKRRMTVSPPREKAHAWTKKDLDAEVARVLRRKSITGFKPEEKFITVSQNFASVATGAGALTLISGITQGTTPTTRVGAKIKLLRMEMSLSVRIPVSTTSNPGDAGLVSVFVYKDPQGAAPAAFAGASGADAPYQVANVGTDAIRADDYAAHFTVKKELRFALNASSIGASAGLYNYLRPQYMTIPLNVSQEFNNGNAGTIADIIKNAVYLGRASDLGFLEIAWQVRIWFADN